MKRRTFLNFLGKGTLAGLTYGPLSVINSCKISEKIDEANVVFNALNLSGKIDDVSLALGFSYQILVSSGDKISTKDTFGTHCDYLAIFPSKSNKNEAILWVNHEYYDRTLLGTKTLERTKDQIDKERYVVGGSIIKIRKNDFNEWVLIEDEENKRITGETKIPFLWEEKIAESHIAEGTLQNCAGGFTPWNTVLTCEENYDGQYGEISYNENNERIFTPSYYQWEKFYPNPPEHYGWVVEVDIKTGSAQKLVAMGRCKHECATVHALEDNNVVIYSADDEAYQHIYKYVSNKPKDLKNGKLYVADIKNGKWLLLDYDSNKIFKTRFKNQTDLLIRMREAAKLIGATPLNRPEDIEIDPISGDVFITLTNNYAEGDFHGSILKITENSKDKRGTSFTSETFLAGGEENMFSSPDNLVFDRKGNLWFATDVSGKSLGVGEYKSFIANGLFLVPRSGKRAGEVIQVASAPNDAEFTGLCFHPNENTLFLSVQHPGETSKDILNLTSHWPQGRNSIPKSSVISISGKSLDNLLD